MILKLRNFHKYGVDINLISEWANYCTIDIIFMNEIRLNDSSSRFQEWNNFLVAYLIQVYKNSDFTKSFYSNEFSRE